MGSFNDSQSTEIDCKMDFHIFNWLVHQKSCEIRRVSIASVQYYIKKKANTNIEIVQIIHFAVNRAETQI